MMSAPGCATWAFTIAGDGKVIRFNFIERE
jgi:hypothetical protein